MALGTVGNVLTIVIATRCKSLSKKSTGIYFTALAIVDLLMLDLGMLDYVLYVTNTDVRNMHDAACRINAFLVNFLIPMDGWIQASMGIERLVAVYYPLQVRILFTRQRALLGILVTTLIVFTAQCFPFWANELQNFEFNGTTSQFVIMQRNTIMSLELFGLGLT